MDNLELMKKNAIKRLLILQKPNNLRIISSKIPSLIDILINTDIVKVGKTKTIYLQDNKISTENRNKLLQICNIIKKTRKTFSIKIVENL